MILQFPFEIEQVSDKAVRVRFSPAGGLPIPNTQIENLKDVAARWGLTDHQADTLVDEAQHAAIKELIRGSITIREE